MYDEFVEINLDSRTKSEEETPGIHNGDAQKRTEKSQKHLECLAFAQIYETTSEKKTLMDDTTMFLAFAITGILLIGASANPFQSFQPSPQDNVTTRHAYFPLDYSRDSLQIPSAWQADDGDGVFDLVVVGGGSAGAYAVKRIHQEFQRLNLSMPKVALIERTSIIGGRLQSALGPGSLGLAVPSGDLPLQEYGGMRVDAVHHPLVYGELLEYGKQLVGDACRPPGTCDNPNNCCPDLFVPMDVGTIRFSSSKEDRSILNQSSVYQKSESYALDAFGNAIKLYSLEDIREGRGSPFDKCVQMILAGSTFAKSNTTFADMRWDDAVEEMCGARCAEMPGLCALCQQFPGKTKVLGPMTCTGYDEPISSTRSFTEFATEVLNIDGGTHLFILRGGYQRFVQSLLFGRGDIPVAPLFQYELAGVSVGGEELGPRVKKHIKNLKKHRGNVPIPQTSFSRNKNLTLTLADGSRLESRAVLLTMLPFDLVNIRGFEAWEHILKKATTPVNAVKIVIGWNDPAKSPTSILGMSPCTSERGCERLILEGKFLRQVWLWDEKTVLLYNMGGFRETETTSKMMRFARRHGMDAFIDEIMSDFHRTIGVALPRPDWARVKEWPDGTILTSWAAKSPPSVSEYLSMPAGPHIPLFYANSEAAKNDSNHGWVEGAFEMVEDVLPRLIQALTTRP